MPDLLIKLTHLPSMEEALAPLRKNGILMKRSMACDLSLIREFIETHFSRGWADEATRGILNQPASCFIATQAGKIVGFACYDATARGFFGPVGVAETLRGNGVGKALYLRCLHAMYEFGYAYCIVGDAGPSDFYLKNSDGLIIPDSWPGEYANLVSWAGPSAQD